MKRTLAFSFFLFAAASLIAQTAGEPTSFGEWVVSTNNPMYGMTLKARLVISEVDGDFGSRTAVAYVELQNTNNAINTLYVGGNPSLRCELRDSSGKVISPPLLGYTRGGLIQGSFWLALPLDSIVRFRPYDYIHAPAAENGELVIHGGNYWKFPRGDTNDYYLSGTLTLMVPKDEKPPAARFPTGDGTFRTEEVSDNVCHGTFQLPPVKISAKKL